MEEKHVIKIMADYECFPLWLSYDSFFENIDPNSLQITQELKEMLGEWADKFDSTLDREYPPDSGFKTLTEEAAFKEQGLRIYEMMTAQLMGKYEVHYFDVFSGVLHKSFEEASG